MGVTLIKWHSYNLTVMNFQFSFDSTGKLAMFIVHLNANNRKVYKVIYIKFLLVKKKMKNEKKTIL